jgi:leucyl/phenylalanyl-tRNA--protein transferase
VALTALVRRVAAWGFRLVDAQVATPLTLSMGAEHWARARFLEELARELGHPTRRGSWADDEPALEPHR